MLSEQEMREYEQSLGEEPSNARPWEPPTQFQHRHYRWRQVKDLLAEVRRLRSDDAALRKELWLLHPSMHAGNSLVLYGDDGEMQCGACLIDFKRDTVAEIRLKIDRLIVERLKEAKIL